MSSWAIMAQNDAPNKGTNKDRINFGAVNSFWLGLEDGMKQRPISQGFNGSIMIDIKTSENSPISFGLGFGFSSHNLHSNAVTRIGSGRTTEFLLVPENITYNINKLSFRYINIPLEVRYRHKSDFRFALGLRSNYLADRYTKYYGNDITGIDNPMKIIDKNILNPENFMFEIIGRVGWKFVTLTGSFPLTTVFVKDKGPAVKPASLGISISLY
jgi:hypothetical protein